MDKTNIGAIKWFDQAKAFGMLTSPEDKDVFFHVNSFRHKPGVLQPGEVVLFRKVADQKNPKRFKAEHCRLLNQVQDWPAVMHYLDQPDQIVFEDAGHRPPRQIHQSLLEAAFLQLSKTNDLNELLQGIKNFYTQELKSADFIAYCHFLEKMFTKHFGESRRMELLDELYGYFGEKMDEDILFFVWKSQDFRFIGYSGMEDYEIPMEVLDKHREEIDDRDRSRIENYSYGQNFQ